MKVSLITNFRGSREMCGIILAVAGLFALSRPAAAQWTSADAQAAFNSYNNAFYFSPGGGNYDYRRQQGDTSTSGFWVGAEEMEIALDAYDKNPTAANATIINQLCGGFVAQFSDDWSGDTYDDDLMWATIAFVRAYKATGTAQWLTDAETNFATVWNRGYDTTYGGGIWWNVATKNYKASASNWTFVIAGNLLYNATGNATYLTEAKTVYQWCHDTLYNASTGEVYDGYGSSGLSTGQFSYNYGVSVAADYFEQQLADANKAATYLMNNLSGGTVGGFNILPNPGQGGGDGSGFHSIALRWIGYVYTHGGISNSRVLAWAQANVSLGWAQRNSAGLSWNNWFAATPDTGQYSWDCANTVAGMLDIPPPSPSNGSEFFLSASPADLNLTPGSAGSGTVTVTPASGFNGPVSLSAAVVGSPQGIVATVNPGSVTGSGSANLNISVTSAAPGGDYVVAVAGTANGISHVSFVRIGLPYFGLSVSSGPSYLNQSGAVTETITVIPHNGFNGAVQLAPPSGLPEGVTAWFQPQAATSTSTLTIVADANAATTSGVSFSVTGASNSYTQTAPGNALIVSAAIANTGGGVPVNLSSAYNLTGIYPDGATYSNNAGLDGVGFSYSSNLLSGSRVYDGTLFQFGPPAQPDAVYGTGQPISLPSGTYTALQLIATGINGKQSAQTVTVTYTDGTTSQFSQSFSDWYSPSNSANEAEGVAMPYRVYADGSHNNAQINAYVYTFLLNSSKPVKSLTLPSNRNVVVLAASLTGQNFGKQVDLSSQFNVAGIYTDGTAFPSDGGLDGGGAAYSGNLVGDQTGPSNLIINNVAFKIGAANVNDALSGTGQPIPLPAGHFSLLKVLGTGVEGNQTAQPVTITYSDGTTASFSQGFSDWFSPQGYTGEFIALPMPYRNVSNGTQGAATFNLYSYVFPLDPSKVVQSFTLSNNRHVVILAASLATTNSDIATVPPSQISTTASGLAYSRSTQTFNGTVTLKNVSGSYLSGPIQILFSGIASGISLVNQTGTFANFPYITLGGVSGLAPGQSASVPVHFKNPANTTINLTPVVFLGNLGQ